MESCSEFRVLSWYCSNSASMHAEPASAPGDGPAGFREPVVIKTNNQHIKLGDGMPVSPQPS